MREQQQCHTPAYKLSTAQCVNIDPVCMTDTVLAEDKLFATLDPTTRRVMLPSGLEVLLSPTLTQMQQCQLQRSYSKPSL